MLYLIHTSSHTLVIMDCLVKAIAKRKVTQLKSSVSKALSSITTNASLSNQVDKKKKPKNSQSQQQTKYKLKMNITKKTKKLFSKLRKMITRVRTPNNTSKHTSISTDENDKKVKTRFDFI